MILVSTFTAMVVASVFALNALLGGAGFVSALWLYCVSGAVTLVAVPFLLKGVGLICSILGFGSYRESRDNEGELLLIEQQTS